jgi:hypothetical protein
MTKQEEILGLSEGSRGWRMTTMTKQEEILGLAVEIADATAMSDIEMFSRCWIKLGFDTGAWYDTADVLDETTQEYVRVAVRYLDLKGELEHHPTEVTWVRRKK